MLAQTSVSLWLAFLAGLASFFSPCVLPLIPVYVAYLAGMASENAVENKLVVNSLGFITGFTIIFVLLGASATLLGQFLLANQIILQKIAGIVIVVFGLHLSQLVNIPFLNFEKRLQVSEKGTGFFPSLLFGLAFGSGWTPCIGPILGSILVLASTTGSLIQGVFLLFIYAIGLAIPFFLAAIFMDRLKHKWSGITRKTIWISRFAGYLMIVFGVMMFFGWLQTLARYLPSWGI